MRIIIYILTLFIALSCSQSENKSVHQEPKIMQYLALGDSYTIGESVSPNKRFPSILVEKFNGDSVSFDTPEIIATTGWTTDELIKAIDEEKPNYTYDLVSLLIGVNNQYRGYPFDQYEQEFTELLNQAIAYAGNNEDRVFVVSIPDYAYTPFGQTKDPEKITKELINYNSFAKNLCTEKNILFLDITPFTQEGLDKPEYVAEDRLHPSALMYQKWMDHYYTEIKKIIAE